MIPASVLNEVLAVVSGLTEEVKGLREELKALRNPPGSGPDEVDTYGINPNAIYDDADLQRMTGASGMTTYRWRKAKLIDCIWEGRGHKVRYFGYQVIAFINNYFKGTKRLFTPINKETPQGI